LPTPIREDYRAVQKFRHVAASLPFKIESEEEMQNRLDLILARLVQAVESQDYEYGLLQWDSILASQTTYNMAYVTENVRKFFPPICIDEMLQEFVPHIIGSNLDYYLPMMFRLWEAVNSYAYDERMLHFLSRLAEMHVDPSISNPKRVDEIPADWDDTPPIKWSRHDSSEDWRGLYKDVGMFSDDEWNFIMCKCLISMEIPLADAGSLTTGPSVDGQAGFEIGRLPRSPVSGTSTPFSAPIGTPLAGTSPSKVADYFSAALGPKGRVKDKKYLGGSKALDSFSKLIISCESFFHPTNGGKWTNDLTALIKYVVFEFNKRWHEELKPDCKVPKLVRCLRTVCLLSIFSSDTTTTSNVQSAFKSMISMEPDLILPSILERAVSALETLTETQRTLAIIKGLGAVSMCMTSRSLYYPGSKHIAPILELLIPGIDLNDPTKTVCTSSLVKDIAQFIKFGDLTEFTSSHPNGFVSPAFLSAPGTPGTPRRTSGTSTPTMKIILPTINIAHGFTGDETPNDSEPRLPDSEEDALVKESTASFSNFVTSWFHRVITLMENLPEEGQPGTRAGGEDEVAVIDNVGSTCVLICQHLSEPLFDLVLNILYDYATSHVRPNALRAIHQLVECLAIADPQKTLERFVPHCIQHIRTEIEHGARQHLPLMPYHQMPPYTGVRNSSYPIGFEMPFLTRLSRSSDSSRSNGERWKAYSSL
ncbi:15387_t:CDS:10, partial [Acaulospora colombiana]